MGRAVVEGEGENDTDAGQGGEGEGRVVEVEFKISLQVCCVLLYEWCYNWIRQNIK